MFRKKIHVVVHNGRFHADDVFAVATLSLYFKGGIKVVRTRDEKIIKEADIVADVGGVYDTKQKRFDHHQIEGAGVRANSIPYASFGLVWKEYGEQVCGGSEVRDILDQAIVEQVDALDNGIDLWKPLKLDAPLYVLSSVVSSFVPAGDSPANVYDIQFKKAVSFARELLLREVEYTKRRVEAREVVQDAYVQAQDKRIIVLPKNVPWGDVLKRFPEPLFVIYPKESTWHVHTIPHFQDSFQNKHPFPESWAGKTGIELEKASGVLGVVFCHRARFLVVTQSKESAVAIALKALS